MVFLFDDDSISPFALTRVSFFSSSRSTEWQVALSFKVHKLTTNHERPKNLRKL